MMERLSERDRRVLTVGGVVLAVLLGAHFVVVPWLEDWRSARAQIEQAEAELMSLRSEAMREDRQERMLVEYVGAGATRPLPTLSEARINFVNAVESVMNRGRVEIRSIDPQPARAVRDGPAGLNTVALRIETRCGLDALARCLAEMQQAERLILVERINATEVDGEPGQVNVTMVLSTLAWAEDQS